MGIDIYLGGYSAFKKRTRREEAEFKRAVKLRDSFPQGSPDADAAHDRALAAYDKMYSGDKGYIRSSYNSSGLFRVLDEIFGFDTAAYLFPGDWEKGVTINGTEFIAKVEVLQRTVILAMSRNNVILPWINEFTELSGVRAPDNNEGRARSEAFADEMYKTLSAILPEGEDLSPTPTDPESQISANHGWYVTHGLSELHRFGELAERIGQPTVNVEISY